LDGNLLGLGVVDFDLGLDKKGGKIPIASKLK
jgi:hypothetical protein